jgi:hypothetical protein
MLESALQGSPKRKQMERGAAREAGLRAARSQADCRMRWCCPRLSAPRGACTHALLDSSTPGKPEAESDKTTGSAGGRIARSAIAGRPESPDASGLRPQVQGALQRVQGRTPETGALRTHANDLFSFTYVLTVFFI